jgi:hypothetical protein
VDEVQDDDLWLIEGLILFNMVNKIDKEMILLESEGERGMIWNGKTSYTRHVEFTSDIMLAVFCTNHIDVVTSKNYEITNEYYRIMSQLLYKTKRWTEDCNDEDDVDFPVQKLSEFLVTGEEFLIKLLLDVLWRSEGKLFFNKRCEKILYL